MNPVIADLIRTRRTISAFRAETPPLDVVRAAIETASWAPNHKKTEPWRIYLLGPDTAKSVVELNSRIIEKKKGATEAEVKRKSWSAIPGWLVVTSVRDEDSFRQEEDYAACCCFVQNLMLGLWSSGIGTKWATGDVTREADFFRIMQIDPLAERVVGLIWYGYPETTPRQSRKPVETYFFERP